MKFTKRNLAILLTAALLMTGLPVTAVAEGGGCTHIHDGICGYVESKDCGHVHDESCGEDGADCGHVHGESCGYSEAVPCGHVHDEDCGGLTLGDPGTTTATRAVTITIAPDAQALYLTERVAITDADLLAGVTATDETGDPVTVTVKDADGLNMATPQRPDGPAFPATPYIITYEAKHPVTGEEVTATRACYVTMGIVATAALDPVNLPAGDYTIEQDGSNIVLKNAAGDSCVLDASTEIKTVKLNPTEILRIVVNADVTIKSIKVNRVNNFPLLVIAGDKTLTTTNGVDVMGSLSVEGNLVNTGITVYVDYNLTVTGTLESTTCSDNYSIYAVNNGLTIDGGTVTVTNNQGFGVALLSGDLTVKNGGALRSVGNAYYGIWVRGTSSGGNLIVESGGSVATTGNGGNSGWNNNINVKKDITVDGGAIVYYGLGNAANNVNVNNDGVMIRVDSTVGVTHMEGENTGLTAWKNGDTIGGSGSAAAVWANVGGKSGVDNDVNSIFVELLGFTVTQQTYTLDVVDGTGSGDYVEGASVTITADTAPTGQQFKEWTITPPVTFTGGTSPASATAMFVMPKQTVTATAVYEPIPPFVISVTVNPSTVTVQKGKSYTFGATVAGANNPPQTVTWSVSPNTNGSSINTNGTLTVGSSETATILTVTATSTSATTVFGTATVTVSAAPKPTPSPSRSSGSGGGGGGSASGTTVASASMWWLERSEVEGMAKSAREKVLAYVLSRRSGSTGIRANALAALQGFEYWHDTLENGAVQVRIYIFKPALAQKDLLMSGYVKGAEVDRVKALFERCFQNQIRVIQLDQQANWGQTVHIAARVNFTGIDTKTLCFYSYDKATNIYKRIPSPGHWVDKAGYLHFNTPYAGNIIISEGPLKGK